MKKLAIALLVLLGLTLPSIALAQTFLCTVDGGSMTCEPYLVVTPTDVPTDVPTNTPEPTVTETPVPTATNTSTPVPSPTHDMSSMFWHAPGAHGGIPAHEHGDAPPAWLTAAGVTVTFDHAGNTPNENALPHKHSARKGYAATLKGVQVYCVWHFDFNPGGLASRFHSYQCYFRDASGGVSQLAGWLDFGEELNTNGNVVRVCGSDSGIRPILMANGYGCSPLLFDTWYSRAGAGFIDVGFSVSPTYYLDGPAGAVVDPANLSTWWAIPNGNNLTRRMELALYTSRLSIYPRNAEFWTDQFSRRVTGPNDPMCSTTITVGAKTYPIVCLPQYIAGTLTEIAFPGNAVQKTFPGNGVQPPN